MGLKFMQRAKEKESKQEKEEEVQEHEADVSFAPHLAAADCGAGVVARIANTALGTATISAGPLGC